MADTLPPAPASTALSTSAAAAGSASGQPEALAAGAVAASLAVDGPVHTPSAVAVPANADGDTAPPPLDWRSPAGHPAPQRVSPADEHLSAAQALRQLRDGTALLWRGSWPAARHLLQALQKRWQAPQQRPGASGLPSDPAQAFTAHRERQAEKAAVLGRLLIPLRADHAIDLAKAPDQADVGANVFGPVQAPYAMSLREWLGVHSASEWQRLGVQIPALKARIHPRHGVFPPVRNEYVDLVMQAPLPEVVHGAGAFDIGTGTGVLAAALARRKLRVTATDNQPAAVACARDNLARLGLDKRVKVVEADLFPPGHAGLIVCNPPWVPAQPFSALDTAVYDPDSRMLRRWLQGLPAHLSRGGEGWLILSDLAEHLGLRRRDELLGWIAESGLAVLGRLDIQPRHPRALAEGDDAVSRARRAEVTSLWRLGVPVR